MTDAPEPKIRVGKPVAPLTGVPLRPEGYPPLPVVDAIALSRSADTIAHSAGMEFGTVLDAVMRFSGWIPNPDAPDITIAQHNQISALVLRRLADELEPAHTGRLTPFRWWQRRDRAFHDGWVGASELAVRRLRAAADHCMKETR